MKSVLMVWLLMLLAAPAYAEVSFATRCADAFFCEGFDTGPIPQSPQASNTGKQPNWQGSYNHITIDPAFKYSGAGAMRMEITSNSAANNAGSYLYFTTDAGKIFGEGTTLYVQFREYLSASMWSPELKSSAAGWKQLVVYWHPAACGQTEIAMTSAYWRGFPIMYTECGNKGLQLYHSPFGGGNYWHHFAPPYDGNTPFAPPNGSPIGTIKCHYNAGLSGCLQYAQDTWVTWSFIIHVGTWGVLDSTVKAYAAPAGQPLEQFIDHLMVLNKTNAGTTGFTTIQLTTYMTNKNVVVAHPAAYKWYDELIVSEAPIPDPYTVVDATPPATPTGLAVQ